jgi:hypothetical protein
MAQKTAEPTLHAADGICAIPPNFEGSFLDIDHGAAPTENLDICHIYQKCVHLEAGHIVHI